MQTPVTRGQSGFQHIFQTIEKMRFPTRNILRADPWGQPYQYRNPSRKGKKFDVFSAGPDGQPDTVDDIY